MDKYKLCQILYDKSAKYLSAILAGAWFDEHIQGGQHFGKFKSKLLNPGISWFISLMF